MGIFGKLGVFRDLQTVQNVIWVLSRSETHFSGNCSSPGFGTQFLHRLSVGFAFPIFENPEIVKIDEIRSISGPFGNATRARWLSGSLRFGSESAGALGKVKIGSCEGRKR